MVLIYIILIIMLLNICVHVNFSFKLLIIRYPKNDYKLKNVLPCKSLCLNLNKTVPKTFNISLLNKTVSKTFHINLLNKMVFLLLVSIIIGYSRLF
jgi:hypothetical protein